MLKHHAFILFLFLSMGIQAQPIYDLMLKGGKIVDGTGNPWYYGDIGIKDGKIVSIGTLKESDAQRTLSMQGMVVAPGFVDVHTHIEGNDLRVPNAENFIYDGVTSVVTGNCGMSNANIKEYFRKLDSVKTSINIATLIGHNTIRRQIMGDAKRKPTAKEQEAMEQWVEQGMKDGAVGLATGLIYVPGTYAETDEIVRLAKVAARYGGVYASHIRNEGDHVTEAIEEAINIGRLGNIPVEISHFKVTYKPNWGKSAQTIYQVVKAREAGIDVTVDQYPYIASSTTLNTQLPTWVFGGGQDSLMFRLADPNIRKKIKEEMVASLKSKQLKDYGFALVARYGADTTLNGKNISEVNALMGRKAKALDEAETILGMVEKGSASMVYFSMNEDDLRRIMQFPFAMIASDAGIYRFGSGVPHPRGYGTNARVLGVYVRDAHILGLEEAIRKMTSLPAQRFNLRDRGILREGMAADVVVFNPNTVGDKATFGSPHAYSTGFRYVLVNGQVVVDEGKHTGVRSGQTLKGLGYRR